MTTAAAVVLVLPGVLEMVVGKKRLAVHGNTVSEALRSAFEQYPLLERHLLTESKELRPHVLCVVNGEVLSRKEYAGFGLAEGDEILIHQAISGG